VLTFRDFLTAFRELGLNPAKPVIVHSSLSAFGEVQGSADTLLGALVSCFDSMIMPTFTYKTMIIPEVGPAENAIRYGSGKDTNRLAEIFHQDTPADTEMGILAESLRIQPKASRSSHPILSFTGMNAGSILASQTLKEPLAPIKMLADQDGWVLLMGVGQAANTSIHYAEGLAGRKQFTRWALTCDGIARCPRFPGCSQGFEQLNPYLDNLVRIVETGTAVIQAIPVVNLIDIVCDLLKENPLALLCEREDCERCTAVRASTMVS
jgi:aminoglycoside 3-N-acetyltransferase